MMTRRMALLKGRVSAQAGRTWRAAHGGARHDDAFGLTRYMDSEELAVARDVRPTPVRAKRLRRRREGRQVR